MAIDYLVEKKPIKIVTDGAEKLDLVMNNCSLQQTDTCTWSATSQRAFAAPESQWVEMSAARNNCNSDEKVPVQTTISKTVAWTDSIGLKVSGGVKLVEVVTLSLEATYKHSVTESRTYSEQHTGYVPPGSIGQFFAQPGFVEVTGDFDVSRSDAIYKVQNATFTFPLKSRVIGDRGQPVSSETLFFSLTKCGVSSVPVGSGPSPDAKVETVK